MAGEATTIISIISDEALARSPDMLCSASYLAYLHMFEQQLIYGFNVSGKKRKHVEFP